MPRISVLIPVKNGGDDLRRCLDAVRAQKLDDDYEIVVIDSGSTDESDELAERAGARVHRIEARDFNHGSTRNLAAALAQGEILVFTSQDAYMADDRVLAKLIAPLSDEHVGGTYARQIAHLDAHPPERFFMEFLYGPASRTQRIETPHDLSPKTTIFSNVCSAIRRDVFERFRFVDDIIMSEDQEWSRRVLLAGYELRYVADAAVHHSHPYTLPQAFRRFFDSGVSAERSYMPGSGTDIKVLRHWVIRYAVGELRYLWRGGNARWVPYAIVYEGAKLLGLQLGLRWKRLPRRLVLRFTGSPAYWT